MISVDESAQTDEALRGSGINFSMTYLGYVPVSSPVSEMGRDLPNLLVKHSIYSLVAMRDEVEGPTANSVLSMMIGPPKLLNLKVVLNISAKQITCRHSEEENDANRHMCGRFLHRHPIKITGIVSQLEECNDCVAYISKKADNSQRRCCVFSADPALVTRVMDTLKKAILLSNNEATAANSTPATFNSTSAQRDSCLSSASVTPAVTPSGSAHDMFAPVIPPRTSPRPAPPPPSANLIRGARASSLIQYPWYHGLLSREVAESRVHANGDFLIRESENQVDQVILSAVCEDGGKKHLLLIDNDGRVMTEDRQFRDVPDLVHFFLDSQTPVRMTDELTPVLRHPIPRPE